MGERTDSLSTGKLGLVVIHASRRTTLLTSHEFHRDKRRRYGNKSKADCHLWFKIFPLKTPKNYQSICLLFFLRRTVCQQVRSCWWTTTFITHIPRIRGISLAVEPRNLLAAVSLYLRPHRSTTNCGTSLLIFSETSTTDCPHSQWCYGGAKPIDALEQDMEHTFTDKRSPLIRQIFFDLIRCCSCFIRISLQSNSLVLNSNESLLQQLCNNYWTYSEHPR